MAANFSVRSPAFLASNRAGPHGVELSGQGTSWDASTAFTLSGVSGVAIVVQAVSSATSATLAVTTGAAVGVLTITDPSGARATVPVQALPASRMKYFRGL